MAPGTASAIAAMPRTNVQMLLEADPLDGEDVGDGLESLLEAGILQVPGEWRGMYKYC